MNEEFARVYGDLEKGVNAIAYVNPYLPLPVFRRATRARARSLEMITRSSTRGARGHEAQDALQVLMDSRYSDGTRAHAERDHGHPHGVDVRGPPHQLGHRGVDADRAAAHPEWMARSSTRSTRSTPATRGCTYQALARGAGLERV
jgi:sterol 14-demethylase